MFLPAVKLNNHVTLENNAFNARRVAAGFASRYAGSGLRYLSVYVR